MPPSSTAASTTTRSPRTCASRWWRRALAWRAQRRGSRSSRSTTSWRRRPAPTTCRRQARSTTTSSTRCRMLGYTEEELMQRTHLDVMHADDREEASLARAQAVSGKARPRLNERRYVRKDGTTLWAHVGGAVPRDAAGRPLYTAA